MDKLILIGTVILLVGVVVWFAWRSIKKGGCGCECDDSCPECGHQRAPK